MAERPMRLRERGQRARHLVALTTQAPCRLVVPSTSPITRGDLTALKGKKIAITQKGSATDVAMRANLRPSGTRNIILPSCIPWIFSGMRVGLWMAPTGTVVGEMIASQNGLGRLIAKASGSSDTTGVLATLLVLALLAMLLDACTNLDERRLRRWQGGA
jgi:ABC-type proline/glycine betaine transport system permease subunit